MHDNQTVITSPNALIIFFISQLLIFAFYFILLFLGETTIAYLIPGIFINLLFCAVLFSYPLKLTNFFLILLPFTLIGLFPKLYREVFFHSFPIFSLLLLGATNFIHHNEFRLTLRPINKYIKLLAVALVASFLNAYYHNWFSLQLLRHAYIFIQSIGLLIIIINIFEEKNDLFNSIKRIFIAASIACVIFIIAALFQGSDIIINRRIMMPFAGYSLNAFALFFGPYIVLGVSFLWMSHSFFPQKTLLILCLSSLVIGLLITQSRGGWFAVLASTMYFFSKKRYYKGIIIIVVLIIIISAFQIFRGILSSRLAQISTGDLSLLARISLWRVAIGIIKKHFLFGVGVNNFINIKYQFGFPRFLDPIKAFNTHNLFLEVLVNLGIIGFIGFFGLIRNALSKLTRIIKTQQNNDISILSLGLQCAIYTFLIHGLVDCGLYLNMVFFNYMIIIGFSWAVIKLTEKNYTSVTNLNSENYNYKKL